jgi:hypothetical protein
LRRFLEKTLRLLSVTLLLCLSVATLSCGNSNNSVSPGSDISGNWQLTLTRHNSTQVWTFSGFLLQSGGIVTGSFILGAGCQGVGPVNGTFDGQNLQLTVSEFGQDFSLTATLPSGSASTAFIGGQFSTLQGGCVGFTSTGTWTAVRITPLLGSFHGSFVSSSGNGTLDVTGTLTQGANIGASNATVSGTITASGGQRFCSYLSTATITGTISGETLVLNLYGPNGAQTAQIPAPPPEPPAIVTADAASLTSSYSFPQISNVCTGDQGSLTLSFP